MCARWFNIDGMTSLPEECENATEHIPWTWKYYEGDDDMQDQLQREWTEYATEFLQIQKQAIDINKINIYGNNGIRCIEYFRSKSDTWEILSSIAIRTLFCVISTADVERIFSVYNYYLSQLDAVNLNSTHKRAKAFILQNKKHL